MLVLLGMAGLAAVCFQRRIVLPQFARHQPVLHAGRPEYLHAETTILSQALSRRSLKAFLLLLHTPRHHVIFDYDRDIARECRFD